MKKMEKKWPFVFNGIVIFCLILLILEMRWQAKKEESEVLNVTESLQKESEIHSFSEEEEAALYMLSALKKNDLDMALRGCAIDETALQINFVKTAEELPGMQLIDLPAPTSDYSYYFPLTSAEMTKAYIEQFEELSTEIPEIETLEVLEIAEKKEKEREEQLAKCLAAQEASELEIYVKCGEQSYRLGFTAVRYEKNWKIHSLKEGLLYETDIPAYVQMEEMREAKKTYVLPNQLTGANYFQAMPISEKTPQRAVEQFIYAIEKGDLTRALAFATTESSQDTSPELLKKQGGYAKELKTMLYGFLGTEDARLYGKSEEQLNKLRGKLNPEYMVYLDLIKVIPIETEENTETVKQYAGLYSYNGKNYLTGYTLCRQEDGWQIQSLSAPALSLESGEVMQLSKEESRKTSEQSVLKAEKNER